MSQDDPFAEPEDHERTVIHPTPVRPKPGRRRPVEPIPADFGPVPPVAVETDERSRRSGASGVPAGRRQDPIRSTGINPIVAAAAPILGLAVRLRSRAQMPEIESLRERVANGIRGFERRATDAGAPPPTVKAARYALCATVDDLVLNTPWGSGSAWAQQSMVVTFYGEAWGGERFFEVLQKLQSNPGRNLEVLELYYLCLVLGFEGQYRVVDRGIAKHSEIRDGLYRLIRRGRGEFERELSPRWRGLQSRHRPLSTFVPLWVVGVVTAVMLLVIFLGFRFLLTSEASQTYAALGRLPPVGEVELARAAAPPAMPPPPPERVAQVEEISRFLEAEIAEGLVLVLEDAQSITVRLRGTGMFGSGSDQVNDGFLPTLERLGQALAAQPGALLVQGHSDDVPVSWNSAFDDNYHLSRARAQSVADLLADRVEPERMTVEGFGPNRPERPVTGLHGDALAEARAANRRVEVVLLR